MKNKHLISVVGPTAIGKTSTSIELASHFDSEIISADSRQFFKEMRIGTAVPSEEELATVPHHFIQQLSVEENYSVGDFERDALAKINELFHQHDILFLVGGSGLYINAINEGLDDFPEVPKAIREELNQVHQKKGIESLQERLKELDPAYYQKVDVHNPHRLIRALEICIATGKPYSSYRNHKKSKRSFQSIKIGIDAERQIIYDRINQRVDLMMENGLLEEVQNLLSRKHLNALNTVGYKELFAYLENEISLKKAIEEIKKNTRRFAKRQLTWFRKDETIKWFDYQEPTKNIIDYINQNTH
ncbi:tRNA (adenosine(37)-N6)-dimethylallyltransferase MiaA [Mesonia sp. K7]|uniref:tRNA (adenosine(37)-N6)-dimethylallyltransferase MiaA n=1 Tax=Mesonia sp. K7 TaxID=2218606 RepID=UPI000DA983F7|nr:tRNA (adenosine(37)-N6)-dimethylallyltransferase MiaA [Mesonia sp. K7]PZD79554.1 tRNA (adenosine(37)-N6)-dimethylallyltransferase MiaA [Mesonia sp. K7]